MAERTGDYEWRIEGDENEAVLYAPDESTLDYPRLRSGIEAATRLPGPEDPVYAAASPHGVGWVAASGSHVAPGLVSVPRVGALLVASSPLDRLGLDAGELPRLLARRLSEVYLPSLGESDLQAACESGAGWAADKGFVEEEDLESLKGYGVGGDPDALGRRALAAGVRGWEPRSDGVVEALGVGGIWDLDMAEKLGIHEGALVFALSVDAGELGRATLDGHRERILSRDFGDSERLVAAPSGTEEAGDLVAALGAAAGYAASRASLLVHAIRRAVEGTTGRLEIVACHTAGGFESRGNTTLHRNSLARLERGEVLPCGDVLAKSTGAMLGSPPAFPPSDAADEGRWVWEETGLLERVSRLKPPGNRR